MKDPVREAFEKWWATAERPTLRVMYHDDWAWLAWQAALSAPPPQVPPASSSCPICSHDKPHGHSDAEIAQWLRAQAGRFLPDWERRIIIELGDRVARDERHARWRHDALVDRAGSERTFDDMVAEGFPKDEAYRRMCQGADLQIVQLRERIYQLESKLAASPPPNTPREE